MEILALEGKNKNDLKRSLTAIYRLFDPVSGIQKKSDKESGSRVYIYIYIYIYIYYRHVRRGDCTKEGQLEGSRVYAPVNIYVPRYQTLQDQRELNSNLADFLLYILRILRCLTKQSIVNIRLDIWRPDIQQN